MEGCMCTVEFVCKMLHGVTTLLLACGAHHQRRGQQTENIGPVDLMSKLL
jgi:hypothetical protein